jgi:hypothetical protein
MFPEKLLSKSLHGVTTQKKIINFVRISYLASDGVAPEMQNRQ